MKIKNLSLKIVLIVISALLSLFAYSSIVYADVINSLDPWTVSSSQIIPRNTANGVTVPSLGGSGTKSVCVDNNGVFSTSGCASSGGGGAGTFSTSTAFGTVLNNYSNNITDVVEIGGTSTSSAKFWFNGGTGTSWLNQASSSLFTANTGYFGSIQATSTSSTATSTFNAASFTNSLTSLQNLTPNSNTVQGGGYPAMDTSSAANAGMGTYLAILNYANESRIWLTGNIQQVNIYLKTKPVTLTNFVFDVWRRNPSGAYDIVGTSTIFSSLSAGANTVTLTNPIAVKEGDYIGYEISFSSSPSFFLIAQNIAAGESVGTYYQTTVPGTFNQNWEGDSNLNNFVDIKVSTSPSPVGVFIGDSIVSGTAQTNAYTEGGTQHNLYGSIPAKLENTLGITIVNAGIGGQKTSDFVFRFTADVINMHPRICFLEGGINDIANGVSASTVLANFATMASSCVSNNIKPVVMLITPWSNGTNSQMQERDVINAGLRGYTTTYGAIIVDTDPYLGKYRVGGDIGNLWDDRPEYYLDGVHFNDAGYDKIANVIADNLAQNVTIGSSFTGEENITGNFINYTGITGTRYLRVGRNTDTTGTGADLQIQAGGAYASSTNLNGGNLNLNSGISVGTGISDVTFNTPSTTLAASGVDNPLSERMRIKGGTGYIGIGLPNPGNPLSVYSPNLDVVPVFKIADGNASGYTQMQFAGTGHVYNEGVGNASEVGLGIANKMYIYDANASQLRMVLDTNGNFGFGSSTPGTLVSLGLGANAINLSPTGTSTWQSGASGINIKAGCFAINGSCISTGSGTPGGSNTQIQYNNSGSFAGSSNLTWNNGAQTLSTGSLTLQGSESILGGALTMNSNSVNEVTSISDPNDAITFDVTNHRMNDTAGALNADFSGSNIFAIGTTTGYSRLSVWGASNQGRLLEVNNSASSTRLWVSGTGFGTTTLSGLNISGSATSTSNVGYNITTGCYAVNGTCTGSGSGSVTAVTGTFPIISSGGTSPNITFGGLSTSTAAVIGNIPYFSGLNTFANVATGTISVSGGITTTAGSSVIGSGLTIGCTTASGSQAGCLSSADWTTFNNKLSNYDWKQENNTYGINSLTPTTTLPLEIKSTASSTFAGGLESFTTVKSGNFVATSASGINATSTLQDTNFGNSTGTGSFTVDYSGFVGVGSTTPRNTFVVQGASANSATKGTCFRAKDVGANTFTYWWFKAGVQTVQTTDCGGTGTTTITYD
jgi:lysophospholipase L1-like esterase